MQIDKLKTSQTPFILCYNGQISPNLIFQDKIIFHVPVFYPWSQSVGVLEPVNSDVPVIYNAVTRENY